jgi:hypothetical protein
VVFLQFALIVDDLVILNAGTAGVALNKADGRVIWHNGKDAGGYATPVLYFGGKKCVALFGCQHCLPGGRDGQDPVAFGVEDELRHQLRPIRSSRATASLSHRATTKAVLF